MTSQEKIERLMEKAMQNGWDGSLKGIVIGKGESARTATYNLIFNHNFARALFGEEERKDPVFVPKEQRRGSKFTGDAFEIVTKKSWSRHLQEAVVSADPVSCMYKAVFGDD